MGFDGLEFVFDYYYFVGFNLGKLVKSVDFFTSRRVGLDVFFSDKGQEKGEDLGLWGNFKVLDEE